MKTLGCKVRDEIYEKFVELGGPISEQLRKAINWYLKYIGNNPTDKVNQPVNAVNQINTDQSNNNTSKRQQDFSLHSKTTEGHILDKQFSSKNYDINQKIVNTKKIPLSKTVNLLVNPPSTFHRISRVNRLLELRQKNQEQKLFKNIKTDDPTSSTFTCFRCPNCGHMINIQSRCREGDITICPTCKQRIYL